MMLPSNKTLRIARNSKIAYYLFDDMLYVHTPMRKAADFELARALDQDDYFVKVRASKTAKAYTRRPPKRKSNRKMYEKMSNSDLRSEMMAADKRQNRWR